VAEPTPGPRPPSGPRPPLFPASLVLTEQKYRAALDAGDATRIVETRAALTATIETLLESDQQRLLGLDGRREHQREREFLRDRIAVLEPRLDALSAGGDDPEPVTVFAEKGPARPAAPPERKASPVRRWISSLRVGWIADWTRRADRSRAPAEREPKLGHRNDIQGLRAVAVLLVVLGHAGVGFLKGGYVGVDVFFVLSGFLITGLLLSEARKRHHVSMGGFYLRRARRILPAAVLTLVVVDFVVFHLLNFIRAKQYLQDSIPSALFTANIHFAAQGTDYFAQGQPPSPLQHFWSLAVEEQFYIVWPAVFAIVLGLSLRRHSPRPTEVGEPAVRRTLIVIGAIAVGSLAWSIFYTQGHAAAAYFSTFARAWELALGAALALAVARIAQLPDRWRTLMGWLGLVLIVIAAVAFSAGTPFPGYAALLPTVGAALVIGAGVARYSDRSAGRMLSAKPLRYVGDRSYTFYLWHWPVLVIVAAYVGHSLSVGVNLLLLGAAFALSVVTYGLFEKPIRNAQWARKPVALLPFAVAVLAVVVLATSWSSSIDNREFQAQLRSESASVPTLALAPVSSPATAQVNGGAASAATVAGQSLPAVVSAVISPPNRHLDPSALSPPIGELQNTNYLPNEDCKSHFGMTTQNICRFGAASSSRTIVVIGDSHAEMWMPAIISLGQRDGWAVVPLLKQGCLASEWTSGEHSGAGQSLSALGDCHAWFNWAMAQARSLHPDVALIAGYYSYVGLTGEPWVLNGLRAAADGVRRSAKRVAIIGDPPTRANNPVDCLLAPNATLASCSRQLTQDQTAITGAVSQMAASDGLGFIDTTGWFCYEAQCPLVIGNIIAYRDDNHLTPTYSTALSGAFRAAFNAIVGPGKQA
jgi:peptidoglycan/LPS O-acetylase OafA/YrhL